MPDSKAAMEFAIRAVATFLVMICSMGAVSCSQTETSGKRLARPVDLLVASTRPGTLIRVRFDALEPQVSELKVATEGHFVSIVADEWRVFGLLSCPFQSSSCVRGIYAISLKKQTSQILIEGEFSPFALAESQGLLYTAGAEGLLELDPQALTSKTLLPLELPRYGVIVESEGILYFLTRDRSLMWINPKDGQTGSQPLEIPDPGHPVPATLSDIVDGCLLFSDRKAMRVVPIRDLGSTDASCSHLRGLPDGTVHSSNGMLWHSVNYDLPSSRVILRELEGRRRVKLPTNAYDWCFLPDASRRDGAMGSSTLAFHPQCSPPDIE